MILWSGRGEFYERSKFSEAQIAFVLKQAEEGTTVGEVCRKAGISEATFYNWRKKYGGLMPSEMRRLRQLEEENAKLKRLVADLSLDKAMLQDVISRKSSEACPAAADRRSCRGALAGQHPAGVRVLRAERSTLPLSSRRADQAELKKRIKEIAETRVRYGYRRIHVLLRREGWEVNAKRVYRLYREMGLQLRNKPPKRRVKAKLRGPLRGDRSNEVWAMDFVHDQLSRDRRCAS